MKILNKIFKTQPSLLPLLFTSTQPFTVPLAAVPCQPSSPGCLLPQLCLVREPPLCPVNSSFPSKQFLPPSALRSNIAPQDLPREPHGITLSFAVPITVVFLLLLCDYLISVCFSMPTGRKQHEPGRQGPGLLCSPWHRECPVLPLVPGSWNE